MKVLILGGTRFLGRALVEEALKRGHEITLFNRGTNKEVFPEVEQLISNRDIDVSLLEGRKWDVVMDTCGFAPHQIKKIAAVLGDNIEHYTYISSISVYKDWIPFHIKEDYPLQSMPPNEKLKEIEAGKISPYEYYGALKVLCETEAEKHWPGRVLHIRAGLLVGPFDYSDRLPYWVQRVAQGGTVLVPGRSDRPVQLVDVKDIATWAFDMAENRKVGTFNVTGPNDELTIEELLNTCKAITNSDAEFVWAEEQFLLEHKVQPWTEMPLWIPEKFPLEGEKEPWKGSFFISIEKAVNAGLLFRPIEDTIHDVYHWEKGRVDTKKKAGITREREQELLEDWFQKETL
ncbi:SDR family oxidoreductase [Bacillus gaemokensis]|uniref:NAD-dependent dehydratase n=1 Tax=Bacillus gaemokensis TaxID=574375 RepID=A0A073K6R5_9BACI|nr:SDR family oxidoreductase [Bacillus gaemokensis]KEK22172.1 NAD-dependent dehydratase [Bacillus gaemokensis]KYG34643.1 NAD-dependent dehydratase [Bacillus gaemokensis]